LVSLVSGSSEQVSFRFAEGDFGMSPLAFPAKLRCLGLRLRLTSKCSRDSPFLRLSSPKNQAVAALRVQSDVVGTRYPQYMGFSFLTRGVFRHYSNCNPCLARTFGKASVRTLWDWHLTSKQGRPGVRQPDSCRPRASQRSQKRIKIGLSSRRMSA
jgi:hypothetical protein